MWYSQAGQDKWVWDILQGKRDGFFVDVGAYDGVESSNTYALELMGWRGICIEANVDAFNSLIQKRGSVNVNIAVNNFDGFCTFSGDRIGSNGMLMPCSTLTTILDSHNCPVVIDYLSIDIEGKEFDVLSTFDFAKYAVKLITVEHNLYCDGPYNKDRIFELLTGKGFIRAVEDVKCLDPNPAWFGQPYEDWYIKL